MELSNNISFLADKYGNRRAAEMCKIAGFTACDYSLGSLEKDDTPLSSDNYREVATDIRKEIEAGGLKITQTHAPFHFSGKQWDTPEIFEEYVFPKFIRTLEITALLGAPIAVVHPLHHWEYRGHEDEIFEKNMVYYRRLIPYCKEFGVKVGVENMWQKDRKRNMNSFDTCGTIPEFLRYIDTLDSEYMVACLDVGHVGLPEQLDEAQDFVRALGHDRLHSLHIHDNDYRGDQHQLPYLGKLNWAEITKALGEIDYDGDFTYEVNAAIPCNVPEHFIQTAVNYMGAVGLDLVRQVEENRPKK